MATRTLMLHGKELGASKTTTLANGFTVETWWDRHTQQYITQLKDAVGQQMGNASFDGERASARLSHTALVEKGMSIRNVPECVRFGEFGCVNCLWSCIECKGGSKYRPSDKHSGTSCENYCWND